MTIYNSTQLIKLNRIHQYLITFLPPSFSHSSNEPHSSYSEYHITISIQHSQSPTPTILTFSLSSSQTRIELTYPNPYHSHTIHNIPQHRNIDILDYFDNFIDTFLNQHIRELFKQEIPIKTTTTSYHFPK